MLCYQKIFAWALGMPAFTPLIGTKFGRQLKMMSCSQVYNQYIQLTVHMCTYL